ncbi:cytochrome b/b6 domain-containing protein [Dethiobacter alkaliphilus]|uniref:Cytochrome B561 n=1 Tax=Dethiobacter alkaliphilus AHT 1 TaxID=555088 RepID=C0GFG0_DETAL|nr:cytochrome b/b6 domain-containing protein [Dethiobacter alkaliphilus]EEG77920.1 cytochrome B561 [Dethiobacter alkaliphilus AHT 1]
MKALLSFLTGKKRRHSLAARVLHWIYAPSILASILSGFYLSFPSPRRGFRNVASAQKTHFIAQFLLIGSYISRIYKSYAVKDYKELVPDAKDIAGLPAFLQHEFFLTSKERKYKKYNPGQKLLFTAFGLLVPLQIFTGLHLYSPRVLQKASVPQKGLGPMRKWHYLSALSIFTLTAGHLYFVFTHDPKKLKSIFTGSE